MVISLASSDLDPPWEVETIVKDIRSLASPFGLCFMFVPRRLNSIAHYIVKLVVRRELLCNRVAMPPNSVRALLNRLRLVLFVTKKKGM